MGFVAALAPSAPLAQIAGVPVFETPAYAGAMRAATQLLESGEAAAAEAALNALAARHDGAAATHLMLALALAAQDRATDALDALARAGALDPVATLAALTHPMLERFANDPRLGDLRAASRRAPAAIGPQPSPVRDRAALMSEANTRWNPASGLFETFFSFPVEPSRQRGPIVQPDPQSALAQSLTALRRDGVAAGNAGDLYDNRDRGHSRLNIDRFPQLDAVRYAPEARARGLDYGLNDRIVFNATVFGNSSTAISDRRVWRSQARLAMTSPGAAERLFAQYAANHLYVYPEHEDHDPKRGDLFPAAMPYLVVSQGSSGSDRPFLTAIAAILAAMRPDVKAFARERGLIAPTVQMLLRLGMAGDAERYLTGAAHPSAFDGAALDTPDLVRLANRLTPETLPAMAMMTVRAEDRPVDGLTQFGDGLSETLFDTPAAIARIARGLARDRRYVLDASPTSDPNGRPLRYIWRVLRGDAARIAVTPLDAEGRVVEVVIPWHERRAAPGRSDLGTDRVDIGLFVDNGAQLSAPAFFSLMFPPRQERLYDADGRILSVDYEHIGRRDRYVDRLLIPSRAWRDDFSYDAEGRLLGWTRLRDGVETEYTRHGARIVTRDALGRPLRAERVRYPVARDDAGRMTVTEAAGDVFIDYEYDDSSDALGFIR